MTTPAHNYCQCLDATRYRDLPRVCLTAYVREEDEKEGGMEGGEASLFSRRSLVSPRPYFTYTWFSKPAPVAHT